MYYANCEWYVDMGEHNKPLCERKGLRPAKCGECPVYIRSIEKENARLREYATRLEQTNIQLSSDNCDLLCDMRDMQFFIDDNTKLRELVADMWRFTGTACKKYPRLFDPAAQGGQMVQLNMIDVFEQRMRDLRIEVE